MTISEPEYLNQLANEIYQKNWAVLTPPELPKSAPRVADNIYASPPESLKPDSKLESGLNQESEYYFLAPQPQQAPTILDKRSPRPFLDVQSIRNDFPIFQQTVNGKPLIWLDNAATTQKPGCVIETIAQYYREYNSNVHRGSHVLAGRATDAYENAREKARELIGASATEEIIFVRGATEAINLVAQTYGRMTVRQGDLILLTVMEHHSNIVPWQLLSQASGAVIRAVPINDRGEVMLGEYEKLLARRPRIVAFTHLSNVLGTVNPARLMTEMAHYYGACVLIDGAQAVPRLPVNVRELDADFYTFSGHKIYGPTGIGVLYGKKALLEEMPPWQGGGNMIKEVNFDQTTYNSLPHKFEAGTSNIAGAIGLGAAIDYLLKIGLANIERHERELTSYAGEALAGIPGLRIIGAAPHKTSVFTFEIKDVPPPKLAHHLDQAGIAVRTGHHCAQPVLRRYGLTEALRVSLGLYNTREEIDTLIKVISKNS